MDFAAIKLERDKFATAYAEYMAGRMTWEEFEPIKKAWGEIAAQVGKMSRRHSRETEKYLQAKYPDQYEQSKPRSL